MPPTAIDMIPEKEAKMLVLTRKTHETILIDGRIEVSVIQVRGNRVKIGIIAPESVSIERSEVAARRPEQSPRFELLGSGI